MFDLTTIIAINREKGIRAKDAEVEPWFPIDREDFKNIADKAPNLGDYVPESFYEVDRLFVDSSGFGNDSEPALTIKQLIDTGYMINTGYAIVEEGLFQLYIGRFKRN